MTTHLPPPDPDTADQCLPGETELAALYRQLPSSEPSPVLDAAVLRAAAQALATDEAQPAIPVERRKGPREPADRVHPKQAATSTPTATTKHRPRWLIGLSSAATLVLAGGLAWHMHEQPRPDSRFVPAQATTADTAPVQAEAEVAAPEPPKQPRPRTLAAQAPPAAPAPTERRSMRNQRAVPAPLRERLAAPALAPMAVTGQAGSRALVSSATSAPSDTAAHASPVQDAKAAPPAPLAERAFDDTAPSTSDTPERELEKIRQLFAQGRDEEARQRLATFQQAHPQRKLPPELQARLRKP